MASIGGWLHINKILRRQWGKQKYFDLGKAPFGDLHHIDYDNHVAYVFKIEQVTGEGHMPVDAILNELERTCDVLEARLPRPKCRLRITTRTIAWAGLLVGLFLPPLIPLDEIIGTAAAFRGPAVGIHEIEVLTPVVHVGQPLVIKTTGEYLRACAWNWVLEWRLATGRPIAIEWHPGSAHVIGMVTSHEMALDLPHGIQPGHYIFHESASGQCNHGEIGTIIDKDVPFTVVD